MSNESPLFIQTFNSITPRWVKNTGIYKNLNNRLLDWLDLRVTKEEIEAAVDAMDVTSESNPGLELSEPPYVVSASYVVVSVEQTTTDRL